MTFLLHIIFSFSIRSGCSLVQKKRNVNAYRQPYSPDGVSCTWSHWAPHSSCRWRWWGECLKVLWLTIFFYAFKERSIFWTGVIIFQNLALLSKKRNTTRWSTRSNYSLTRPVLLSSLQAHRRWFHHGLVGDGHDPVDQQALNGTDCLTVLTLLYSIF